MAAEPLYRDKVCELDDSAVTLRRYYFPFATPKRIAYTRIRAVRQRPMGALTGKGRIWGSGDFRHWAPLDPDRSHKSTAISLDLGRYIVPVFSPEDPERVLALLDQHVPASTR